MSDRKLEEMVDHSDKEFTDYIARKTLKELLKLCETHDISKQGLIEEMDQGLHPEKDVGEVETMGGHQVISLDIEEIAYRGEKRINLDLNDHQEHIPRKITVYDMKNSER